MHPSESGFLKEMLYESLFVPKGRKAYPRSVLELPELLKYYKDWGSIPHDLAVVAEENGQLVGAVWGRAHQPPCEGFGFVGIDIPEIGVAVFPAFRSKGIGTELINSISRQYQARELSSISLSVDRNNPAKALYDRLGFLVVKENEHDFIMQKMLNP
ncbi:MAG: GNAT family N-acetyltransferase [FCB group bacterium]|nr:GNAT family N-acetyltransferase [FCB group bacterium]MBL7027311.1 GNAT family N-acetyltransferase [Candidatus Neomarinimicrobiota bacterium]MBL7122281.1 GNAT family N-acetyltransferase [Candidatus Neomarinimicrobiota bacterium]